MDLLTDKVRPMYYRLLVAAVGSALVACVFGTVDAVMIGQYHGPEGTAVLAVFNPLWSLVYSMGFLAGTGGPVLFANARGRGDRRESDEYFTVSILFGVGLSVAAMVVIGIFQNSLLRFFGAKDDEVLLKLAKTYLQYIWFAIPCCIFSNILSAYLRNDGNAGLATKAVLCSGIFNVVGDYILIFVCDMGIAGAGLATMIGLYISNLIMLTHFFSKRSTLRFARVTHSLHKLGRICTTGFSTAFSDLSMGVISIIFNQQIMLHFGTTALSVYGILTQVVSFAQCCAYGGGQAAQPIISQNHGARQFSRIRECLRWALYACIAAGMLWLALAELAPNLFVYCFMTPTADVLAIAPVIIRIYGLSFVFLPFNVFATYYFQAIMKPNISLIASLARGLVVSGLMIMLLPVLFGADAMWFAMLVTELLVAAFSVWQMVRCNKALQD